ncbi:MAG: hypothetical protein KDI88_09590 [Gammaproteobacteria bacterium]|nr:hypothetical protein [Gammaproteobacteria bacterium]
MKFPRGFPECFRDAIEDVAKKNPVAGDGTDLSEAFQRLVDALDLKEFWPFAERAIRKRHASGVADVWVEVPGAPKQAEKFTCPDYRMVGDVEQWLQGFARELFLQLFAPKIAKVEKLGVTNRKRSVIAKLSERLSEYLESDPELLVEFMYWQRSTYGHHHPDLVEILQALQKLAIVPVQPHLHEPPNPGAKRALTNQRGIALRSLFLRYTGHKHWRWIESLLEVAEGASPGNVRSRIED